MINETVYTYPSQNIVVKTPTVIFSNNVSNQYIEKFLHMMAKGDIKVIDYQGNELEVRYYRE